MAESRHVPGVRSIVLCVVVLAACHDDVSLPAGHASPVAAMRHVARPPPVLPPVIDRSNDAPDPPDEDDVVVVAIGHETEPVGEEDRDSEGIPDSEDRCPDEPEMTNGFEDDDGCPDPVVTITAANGPM